MFPVLSVFGISIKLYTAINTVTHLLMAVFILLTAKEYKSFSTHPALAEKVFNRRRKNTFFQRYFYAAFEAICVFAVLLVTATKVGDLISLLFLGHRADNFFTNILFVPFALFALGVVLHASPLKLNDYVAPLESGSLILYKIACFCQGCCNGVEMQGGMYNTDTERYEFPVQLVEAACAAVIFAVILVMRKRKKRPGFLYPVFMITYSGSRFFSEFWRDDYPAILWKMTGYHLQCILGVVFGAACLIVVIKYGERITAFFEARNRAFYDKQCEKIRLSKPQIQHKKK